MASVDKAAIGWSIAIVAVAIGITMTGLPTDTGFTSPPATSTTSDSKIEAAKQQIAMEQMTLQEEQRVKAMAEQKGEMGEASVELSAPTVEVPQATGPMSVDVAIPTGTTVPGCEETNDCYLPENVSINAGDTVIWSNTDTAAHTVTSGSPTDGPDGIFDSSLFMAGATFEVTFDDSGSYDYFCMVHPWMKGNVQVS